MKNILPVIIAVAALVCGRASTGSSTASHDADKQKVQAIFAIHDVAFAARDQPDASVDAYLNAVADDIILMPHDAPVMEGKAAYGKHLREIIGGGRMAIRHELIEAYSYAEIVIARGRAVGSFTPNGQSTTYTFETKNVFIFRRLKNGDLKVWQIIFNHNPATPATPPAS